MLTAIQHRKFFQPSAVALACLAAASAFPALGAANGGKLPNIMVILSDDHGYADLSIQGCSDVSTPNIDSIAKSGVRFTDGYVSCPVCSPSRAGLMTGRYQQRFGHEYNDNKGARTIFGLPTQEKTIADRLKHLGYTTGIIGKWHLGYTPDKLPQRRGFDEFFGFHAGAHAYFDPTAEQGNNAIFRGTQAVDETEYLTHAFTREALSFIDRHKATPFFLYLPYNAIHFPMEAPPEYLAKFKAIPDEKRRIMAAMLSCLDDSIGKVLSKLREHGLEENTLIFFLGDNGGYSGNASRNRPLRGGKHDTFEGGIRVPFCMQWKSRIGAGQTYRHPVISLDILPTVLAAANATANQNIDGVNLLPFILSAKQEAPHSSLFWRMGKVSAVRMGDWKYLETPKEPSGLFNLAEDIGEQNNLVEKNLAKLAELKAAYAAWNSQMATPLWGLGAKNAE